MLDIKIVRTTEPKAKPQDESKLGFGKIFTDHMFLMDYTAGEGWHDARVVPYASLPMDPATVVFHYAQEIFEGMKAYRTAEGKVQLFCADAMDGEGLLNGDLPQRRRAEQSVHDGVRQHIGVAVAEQALFIRHLYAAENEPPPLRQAVDVVAVSYAQARHSSASRSSRRRRIASATIRSSGVVILMFSSSPSVK